MMGHRTDKPKYGDGYGLGLKLKYLQLIALTPAAGRAGRRVIIKASLGARHDVVGGAARCDLTFQPLEDRAVHRAVERHRIGDRSPRPLQALQRHFLVLVAFVLHHACNSGPTVAGSVHEKWRSNFSTRCTTLNPQ